jgi:hypothetical protein
VKRVISFLLALAVVTGVLAMNVSASGGVETDSLVIAQDNVERIIDESFDTEQTICTLNDVLSTNDYKDNIFNNILNSIDYYDAVEGSFITTLWRDDGEPTVVSYASDINAQKSYQEISSEDEEYKIYVTGGEKYTVDVKSGTQQVENVGLEDDVYLREKQTNNIYLPAAYMTASSGATNARVGEMDGVPIYYYRNDLTNCDYAAVSIFPQTLAFGLLANFEDWEIVDTDTYLGRNVIIIQGEISDPVYSEKINSSTYELFVDVETGIVLEFVGYDFSGNETESIKTTDISVLKNDESGTSPIGSHIDSALVEYQNNDEYGDIVCSSFSNEEHIERSTASATSISNTIDNDTIDSNCYNDRSGFLAYLNDSNYYNKDMRRTNSNSSDHYYGWHSNTVLDHTATDYISVSLSIYLYSSTSKDPAAAYGVYTVGMVGDSVFNICTMDQATAPNGWNSFSKRRCLGNAGYITGIEMNPSGKGSTYTGADAIKYTMTIS